MAQQRELGIGEAAAVSGLPATTIRFYEERGVLPQARRAANGYRVYEEADIRRLRFARNARALDFTTEEVRSVLALRDEGQAACPHVLQVLQDKVALVATRRQQMAELQRELEQLLAAAEPLPVDDVAMEGCVCALIREKAL